LVDYKLKLPKRQNVVWIPKPIADALGRRLRVTAATAAAVLYPADSDLEPVIQSLDVIRQDLAIRQSIEQEKRKG